MLREVLQVLRSEYAFALITASLAVLLAVIAFELVGYLGLAMLGVVIGWVKDVTGSFTSGLWRSFGPWRSLGRRSAVRLRARLPG